MTWLPEDADRLGQPSNHSYMRLQWKMVSRPAIWFLMYKKHTWLQAGRGPHVMLRMHAMAKWSLSSGDLHKVTTGFRLI